MSNDPTPEEKALAGKINIVRLKTGGMKKGLTKKKNLIAAKKKDLISEIMQPPLELTQFLQSQETFDTILKAAEDNKQAIIVRRYVSWSPTVGLLGGCLMSLL